MISTCPSLTATLTVNVNLNLNIQKHTSYVMHVFRVQQGFISLNVRGVLGTQISCHEMSNVMYKFALKTKSMTLTVFHVCIKFSVVLSVRLTSCETINTVEMKANSR